RYWRRMSASRSFNTSFSGLSDACTATSLFTGTRSLLYRNRRSLFLPITDKALLSVTSFRSRVSLTFRWEYHLAAACRQVARTRIKHHFIQSRTLKDLPRRATSGRDEVVCILSCR